MSGVPLFAKVLVSAPADTSGDFMLHLSPTPFVDHDDIYGDYGSFGDPPRFHSDTIDYFSIPFNTETQIFSWFTEDAGYFVTTQDGLWSLAGALPRGGELTDPNLHPRDSVKVVCDPSIYPMGLDLVLFHSETYQPFPATPSPGFNGNALLRGTTAFYADFNPYAESQTIRVFRHVPPGDYILEGWTDANYEATVAAPIYQTAITVPGGSTVVLQIP